MFFICSSNKKNTFFWPSQQNKHFFHWKACRACSPSALIKNTFEPLLQVYSSCRTLCLQSVSRWYIYLWNGPNITKPVWLEAAQWFAKTFHTSFGCDILICRCCQWMYHPSKALRDCAAIPAYPSSSSWLTSCVCLFGANANDGARPICAHNQQNLSDVVNARGYESLQTC